MSAESLSENASAWLRAIAERKDIRKHLKGRALTDALIELRRQELIDKDGRITDEGKKVIRLGTGG